MSLFGLLWLRHFSNLGRISSKNLTYYLAAFSFRFPLQSASMERFSSRIPTLFIKNHSHKLYIFTNSCSLEKFVKSPISLGYSSIVSPPDKYRSELLPKYNSWNQPKYPILPQRFFLLDLDDLYQIRPSSELFISLFWNSAFWGVLCGLIIPMQPEFILLPSDVT